MSDIITWSDVVEQLDRIQTHYSTLYNLGYSGEHLDQLLRLSNWDKGTRGYIHSSDQRVVYRMVIERGIIRYQVRSCAESVEGYTDISDPGCPMMRKDVHDVFYPVLQELLKLVNLYTFLTEKSCGYTEWYSKFCALDSNLKRLAWSQLDDEVALSESPKIRELRMGSITQILKTYWKDKTGMWI